MAVRKCDPAEILLEENDFERCELTLENRVLTIRRRDLCIAEIYLEEAEVQEFPGFGVTSFALAHVDGWRVILKTTTRKQKTDWINIIQSLKIVHSPKSAAKKPKILALSKVKLELLRKSHTHQYLKLDKKDYTITKNMQPSSVFYSIRERTMSNGSLGINISAEVTKQHSLPLYERRRLKTYSKFSENGPTLREMIKKSLLTDEWYHWSNLLQEENISGMSDLEKRQQIMMLQFIIYEVAINIDLAELVNLAKQSITWNSSLVSYNKRTIASCLDKMKQTSESLLAEFDELWKTKKNLIKVLYIYQKYMDRYDSYITYMSYFNDFQSVLHEAIEHKKHISTVLPSKRFGIMRTCLPLFQISALCLLLEELVNKPIFKKLEQFHCNLILTQFNRIFNECLNSLKSSCGELEGNNIVFEVKTRAVNLTAEILKKTHEVNNIDEHLINKSSRTFKKRSPVSDVKKIKQKSNNLHDNKEGKTLIRDEINEYNFALEEMKKLYCLEHTVNEESYSDTHTLGEITNPLKQLNHEILNLNYSDDNLGTISSDINKIKPQEKFDDTELNTNQDRDVNCHSSKNMDTHSSADNLKECNISNDKQFVSFLQINLRIDQKHTNINQDKNGLSVEDSVNVNLVEDSFSEIPEVNSYCDSLPSPFVDDFDLSSHDEYLDCHNNTETEYFWDYGMNNDVSPYFETYKVGDSNESVLIESAVNIELINSRHSFGRPEHSVSINNINEAINKSMIFGPNDSSFYEDYDTDLAKYHHNKYALSVFSGQCVPIDYEDDIMFYFTADSHESLPKYVYDSDESSSYYDDDDGYESFSFSRQQVKRNDNVTLKTLQKWRESFKDKDKRIETQTNDPLPDAPLYQNFNFSATPIILDDGHIFTLAEVDIPPDKTEDLHIYEHIICNDEGIKPDKCQKEKKDLNNCQKSSLRTLWCETLEVIESGILDSMTHQKKKLQEAKFEIITSEVSYLKSLSILITKFVENSELNNLQILTYKNRHILFQYVNKVKECSEEFLQDLVCVWENDLFLINLGQVVLHHANQKFDIYIDYCGHQFLVNKLLSGLSSKNKRFSSILRKIENEASEEKFTLQSFLTLPMQRITRFPMLVEAILKYMEPSDEEYEVWKNVHASFIVLTNECNAHCSLTDNCTKKSEERNMFKTIWNRFHRKKRF